MLTLLCLSAFAADNEVNFDVGWLGAHDQAWNTFSDTEFLAGVGVRGGLRVHDRVAIVADFHHSWAGADNALPSVGSRVTDGYDDYYDESYLTAAMWNEQLAVGAKADLEVWRWFHPYVTLQAVAVLGVARLDDDANDPENLTQIQRIGFTGGARGHLGMDFPIHATEDVAIAPYLEMGYGWLAPMYLEDLGTVQFSGFSGHAGVGVRF